MWQALPASLPLSPRHVERRALTNPYPRPIAPPCTHTPRVPHPAERFHALDAWVDEETLARDLAAFDGRPFVPVTFERLRKWGGAPPFQYHGKRAFYLWGSAVTWAANIEIHPEYFKPRTWR